MSARLSAKGRGWQAVGLQPPTSTGTSAHQRPSCSLPIQPLPAPRSPRGPPGLCPAGMPPSVLLQAAQARPERIQIASSSSEATGLASSLPGGPGKPSPSSWPWLPPLFLGWKPPSQGYRKARESAPGIAPCPDTRRRRFQGQHPLDSAWRNVRFLRPAPPPAALRLDLGPFPRCWKVDAALMEGRERFSYLKLNQARTDHRQLCLPKEGTAHAGCCRPSALASEGQRGTVASAHPLVLHSAAGWTCRVSSPVLAQSSS